jgi:hypothetical protein
VNADGKFGQWSFAMARDVLVVPSLISEAAGAATAGIRY